jgi:hypothetical protein
MPQRVLRMTRFPLGGGALGAVLLGGLGWIAAPAEWAASLGYELEPAAQGPFLCVWATHLGAYVGGVIGLVSALRRSSAEARSAER